MRCEICMKEKPCAMVETSHLDDDEWVNVLRVIVCGGCADIVGSIAAASVKSLTKNPQKDASEKRT